MPIAAFQTKNGAPNNVYQIRKANLLSYVGSLSDFYNKQLVATVFNGLPEFDCKLIHCFSAVTENDARNNASTFKFFLFAAINAIKCSPTHTSFSKKNDICNLKFNFILEVYF